MNKTSRIPKGLTLRGPELDHYYHDFSYELPHRRPTDAAGIPLWDYGYPIGAHYHPVLLGAYALALHERFLQTGDAATRQEFFKLADFLVEMQKASRTGFGWEYDVPSLKYYVMAPWVSGMGQGLAMSALLRAYVLDPKPCYFESATRALTSFQVSAPAGGCREVDRRGNVWYEEAPSTAATGSAHILNGFLFALWGLYDYLRVAAEPTVRMLYQDGMSTLQATIREYDTGYWTRYSLTPKNYLADRFYHGLHIDGAHISFDLTGDVTLDQCAKKWASYSNSPKCSTQALLVMKTYRVIHKYHRLKTLIRLG